MSDSHSLLNATASKGRSSSTDQLTDLLKTALASKVVVFSLDWGALILFYVVDGFSTFRIAALVALAFGVFSIAVTHLRSVLDPAVISPKVLDLGFVATFAAFVTIGFASTESEYFGNLWCNAIMDGALAMIVVTGVFFGAPFTAPYAIEAGMPRAIANDPFMVYTLSKDAMDWAKAFLAMTFVSSIAPTYRCAEGAQNGEGCFAASSPTFEALDIAFTGVAQYLILTAMLYKTFKVDSQRMLDEEEWAKRPADEVARAHGVPIAKGGSCQVMRGAGRTVPCIVTALSAIPPAARLPSSSSSFTNGGALESGTSGDEAEVQRAAQVLAAAFVNDPLFLKWPKYGAITDTEKRRTALEPLFLTFVRMAAPYNHAFALDGGKAFALCVPAWPRGDEASLFFGMTAIEAAGWTHPLPPVEIQVLSERTKAALRGRQHLYIFLLAADPQSQGQGYGGAALRQALSVADARGVPVALETMTNQNRRLYEKHGFRVVGGELQVEGCQDPWVAMVREPEG
mmetsp:Transcript_20868/g.41368  ORF Transcript_20868/g.41368 Transcript_20868/m.41368 type:complete len:513 (+) Transcript_20868:81-1619(+)